ncbi:MAG: universal stress protein [Thermomicrobiales bacterium]|nr:universal stress protein [Thermomicrobiales bacterium]MCO5220160.1 universal stress protein [Thermomicrobiales bacterium]
MTVLTYIDRSPFSRGVLDAAVWLARRLDQPVELVHTVTLAAGRSSQDLSGYMAVDAPETAFEKQVPFDEAQNRVRIEDGHRLLDAGAAAVREAGIRSVTERLYQGTIAQHLAATQENHSAIVVGRQGESTHRAPARLGRNIEYVLQTATRPVVIAPHQFVPIERSLIAWDGGRSCEAALDFLVANGLLTGDQATLLHVGHGPAPSGIRAAGDRLTSAGVDASIEQSTGQVAEAILRCASAMPAELVIMGAFGHSRLRRALLGSTTSAILLNCPSTIMVVRSAD